MVPVKGPRTKKKSSLNVSKINYCPYSAFQPLRGVNPPHTQNLDIEKGSQQKNMPWLIVLTVVVFSVCCGCVRLPGSWEWLSGCCCLDNFT